MAQIGLDCEIILDGIGYFVKPGTYQMRQPRNRQVTLRADGGNSYVDLGPGKRIWEMTLLCINELKRYDGANVTLSGQQYRDALRASFISSIGTTINFVDPLNGSSVSVHFDTYQERILNLHSQIISLSTGGSPRASYEVSITLIEA
ncbi:hypothetical protein [Ktedonospora formicarum]|uniref:Uncharacterized protein n=1 Tax=Ktedonospora formicarum TaxID=2778364 RepID=A0A8J3IBH4_9CHLR|nr:hypothetical protein [Ktedonospora formicarum]GHO49612.1 hypothetical protein KSX_77750 [Ktedonospora formicarum]